MAGMKHRTRYGYYAVIDDSGEEWGATPNKREAVKVARARGYAVYRLNYNDFPYSTAHYIREGELIADYREGN